MAINEQFARRIRALEAQAQKRDVYERHIPYCVVTRDQTDQTIPATTWTNIEFDLEIDDVGSLHENVTNPDRIMPVVAGCYLFEARIIWEENAGSSRYMQIMINDATIIARTRDYPNAANQVYQDLSFPWHMDVGDYATVAVFHGVVGGLDVDYAASYSPIFSACLLG